MSTGVATSRILAEEEREQCVAKGPSYTGRSTRRCKEQGLYGVGLLLDGEPHKEQQVCGDHFIIALIDVMAD